MVKIINNYTLIDQIGEGNYGSVYRAVNSKKQGEFAVKIIPIEKFQENLLLE
jgi:serine/threonine protein kinase